KQYGYIGRVSEINTYPIKACGGITLKKAEATRLGIKVNGLYDRHWLVVKPNGDFITMRQHPELACIEINVVPVENEFILTAPGMESITLPIKPKSDRSKVVKCRVWQNQLQGQDCGDEVSRWLSEYLKTEGIRLLFSAPDLIKSQANSRNNLWGNSADPGDQGAYQDECCGYLIMNENSLVELNTHLKQPVTFRNFRPNIVIDGPKAFDEDYWKELRIGESLYVRILDPCARCVVTTVDPIFGRRSEDGEPLKTLSSIRCVEGLGKSPFFGVLATVDESGPIKVGDPVYM
ncbi:hypothetical protein LOTGIDRAFT_95254, partial [Lottia gigantea]